MADVGFGIIGCGMIADWHAKAIQKAQGAYLVGVADRDPERAAALAARYEVKAYSDYEELLARPEVTAVSICTPSGLHAPLAIAAARAGKHLLVEKPLAISREQADAVLAAAKATGVKLGVVSQLRFSPAAQKVKMSLAAGKLGRLLLGDAYMKYYRSQEYYDRGGWRGTWAMDGGGALMNQGIHGIDLLLWFMGPVAQVSAQVGTLARRIEVEDTAVAILRFANGAMGVIEATTSVYPGYHRRLEINGECGSIILEEDRIVGWDLPGEEGEENEKRVAEGEGRNYRFASAREASAIDTRGHELQIQDLVEAIQTDRAPAVTGEDGRRAVNLILAIYEAAQTGRVLELEQEDEKERVRA